MDKISVSARSKNMSKIRSKDTKIEIFIRKALFARGLRYRINVNSLPGRPDIVFPKHKAIIQINGCFWHGHSNCKIFRMPKSNLEYWDRKIGRNRFNDQKKLKILNDLGWRVKVIWECEIKRRSAEDQSSLIDILEIWIREDSQETS